MLITLALACAHPSIGVVMVISRCNPRFISPYVVFLYDPHTLVGRFTNTM